VTLNRNYEVIQNITMGKQEHVDIGQTYQRTSTGKELKLHSICFVLSHSRFKLVVWQDLPYTLVMSFELMNMPFRS
jgi:hypothetical protein